MVMLDETNVINLALCLATIAIVIVTFSSLRREHWATLFFEYKPAFRKAWREVRNENIYYKGFVPFMDTLAGIRETNPKDD